MSDWPIDPIRRDAPQRVLIEAEVYALPDPEDDDPEDRYYTFAIANGDPHVQGSELLSIREDHVRGTIHRAPQPEAQGGAIDLTDPKLAGRIDPFTEAGGGNR